MRFSVAAVASALVAGVYAADHVVTVGENGTLAFNPSEVTAAQGDNVIFQFRSKNHSVTQSTFASPCVASGIDSGFQMTPPNATSFATWSFTVDNASTPLWFFCAQTVPAVHCNAGMVFAVNPTPQKTFQAFQDAAKGNNGTAGASPSASAGAAGASGSTPSVAGGAPGASDASGASGAPSSSPSTTDGVNGAAASANNGAMHMGASTLSLVTLAALVAGLVL